jgi:hypothetical protein
VQIFIVVIIILVSQNVDVSGTEEANFIVNFFLLLGLCIFYFVSAGRVLKFLKTAEHSALVEQRRRVRVEDRTLNYLYWRSY